MKYLWPVLFLACVPLGNVFIGHVGTVCVVDGPCLVPVWPGLMAPSGVFVVGLALVLRDEVQERLGRWWSFGLVLAGASLSAALAPGRWLLAGTVAFLLSELADWAVYEPLRKRGHVVAVLGSGVVGLVADSTLFLWLAFGSLDFVAGQIVGKGWALLAATVVVYVKRNTYGGPNR